MIFDCGQGASLLLNNSGVSSASYTLTIGLDEEVFSLGPDGSVVLPCSGQVEVVGASVQMIKVPSPDGAFNEPFLLGLAGLLCGYMLVWAWLKGSL